MIKREIRAYCKELFEQNNRIVEIIIIGSFVNGGFNKKSDIDIVLCFNPDYEKLADTKNEMSRLLNICGSTIKGYPVDLMHMEDDDVIFTLEDKKIGYYTGEYESIMREGLIKKGRLSRMKETINSFLFRCRNVVENKAIKKRNSLINN